MVVKKIKGIKPHQSADDLDPIIGIDTRVEPAYRRQSVTDLTN